VLNDLSATVRQGESAAIVGPSGCGKTTVTKLLLGFYAPEQGQICINGQPISQMDLEDLRRNVAYVSQDVTMFTDTLRNNLLIGNEKGEAIKLRIGAVYDHRPEREMEVHGLGVDPCISNRVTVSSREILEALMDPITAIIDTVCTVIEHIPAELVEDVLRNGITLTGGGAAIYGLDRLIEDVTHIRTRLAKDPHFCVAVGTGRAQEIGDLPETPAGLLRTEPQ
jgi:ABC-type multidrug transport system fused ATPase/permease subunit